MATFGLDVVGYLQALSHASQPHILDSGDPGLRNPITGIAGCCARAANGHAAAPPISVMNSRRRISWPGTARNIHIIGRRGLYIAAKQSRLCRLGVMRVGLSMRQECPLFLQSLPKWWAAQSDEKGQ